jgi:antitoxin (DNA-binding transcriptional repressor) of toxin-antitoxin stability system
MVYTTYQARTHLSRLLREAEAGKEFIVLRGKKPVAKIVAIQPPAQSKSEPPAR